MEYLRWILLAGGILFVILVYLLGRRRRNNDAVTEDIDDDELPAFSARDWDNLDEGVGEVRIIARASDETLTQDDGGSFNERASAAHEPPTRNDAPDGAPADTEAASDARRDSGAGARAEAVNSESLVIVLYLLAQRDSKLTGDRINTAVRANGMVFGDMNIFHRLDTGGKPVYSLANMLEPGTFDPVSIHEMRTPGVILFMQLPGPPDPLACFNDMLQIACRIAEMLDARLCNSKREQLTEADTENLRARVAGYAAG